MGSNPFTKRRSSIDQQGVILSPLNEFDENYDNPLNIGMMLDSTVSGCAIASKRQHDVVSGDSLDQPMMMHLEPGNSSCPQENKPERVSNCNVDGNGPLMLFVGKDLEELGGDNSDV